MPSPTLQGFTKTPSTLNSGLVAYWQLEEASGQRNDSKGTNHLTDNNTVTQATGKIGNAAQFTSANSEYLSIADNAELSIISSLTLACWIYLDTVPVVDTGLFAKWEATGDQRSYALYVNGSEARFKMQASWDGTDAGHAELAASSFGAPSTAIWYLVVGTFDDTADQLGISVNNGTVNTTAYTNAIFNSTAVLQLARRGGSANYLNGRMDAVGIWNRKLTATEITELYHGGAGKEYPF